jgi:trigger factor
MTDENSTEQPGTENPEALAAPEAPEAPAATAVAPSSEAEARPERLHQQVQIRDIGPCRKHIRVTVERPDIDARLAEKFSELVVDAPVAGFRPGKAPRKIIERRFRKEVGDEVKREVMMASLQQLAEENDIAALEAPDLDPSKIDLPDRGPLIYEFEIEVRPQFDLPDYKGLRLRRPVHTFTEEEVIQEERRLLTPYGQVVPKPEGDAREGDILVAEAVFKDGDQEVGHIAESQFRVQKVLAFKDGLAERFAEQVRGANPGDTRVVDVSMSSAAASPGLRGKQIQGVFQVKDVKTLRLPELTPELLHNFGVHSPEQLRELARVVLERRLEYQQRRSARQQVLEHINAAATWRLPQDLLARHVHKAMARRAMEMRGEGISEEEIARHQRLMQQDVLRSTEMELKEHFVLQKIAEVEKIDVNEDDINDEISRLAEQTGESPRRIRAQLEKEDMLDALVAEMIERKALDLILDSAVYEDVPLGGEEARPTSMATLEVQAVPGEMHDPAAPPPAPAEAAPPAPPETPATPDNPA